MVQHLHSKNICHRDIKLENILLVTQSTDSIRASNITAVPPSPISPSFDTLQQAFQPTIRLADFGLARPYPSGERLTTRCGSEEYASPQLLRGEHGYHPEKTDVWALGCVLFAMLTGEMAFHSAGPGCVRRMYTKICTGQYNWPSGQHREEEEEGHLPPISDEAKRMVQRCLEVDESRRADCAELLLHPWFQRTLHPSVDGEHHDEQEVGQDHLDQMSLRSLPSR